MSPSSPRPAGARLRFLAGIGISAIFLYAMLAAVPLDTVLAILGRASPGWLVVALAFIGCGYAVRIMRWRRMIASLGGDVRLRDAAVTLMGSVALNNVLPLRAGDVLRVVAFQRFTGVPRSDQLGTLMLERLLDLIVLVGLLFATISFWSVTVLPEALIGALRVAAAAVVVGVLLFVLAPGAIRPAVLWIERRVPRARRAGDGLLRLSDAISRLCRPPTFAGLGAISLVAWLAEGGAFFAAAQAIGIDQGPQAILLALSVGTLSTIIPSSPGYVGTFHYFTALVITAFGAAAADGAAYAILIHALLWLSTTACGFLLLWLSQLPRPAAQTGTGD